MKSPAIPPCEPERLAGLRSLDVLDTPAEERFDRITRLAKALLDVPIALISLVDDRRQWFKSRQGLSACETSREISFCGHAILTNELFWIEDAQQDERFHDNPLVAGEPHIRFYAGYPLHDRQNNALGTLCVIDRKPRPRSAEQLEQLVDLAHLAENELDAVQLGTRRPERTAEQRKDLLDPATGVWNREGMLEILEFTTTSCADRQLSMTLLTAEIEGHSQLDETWTEQGGELILGEVAQVLRRSIRTYDSIGRIADDRFLLILVGLSADDAVGRVKRFQRDLDESSVLQSIGVRMHFGFTCWEPGGAIITVDSLLDAASESVALASAGRRRDQAHAG